jgi:hypothetical protein
MRCARCGNENPEDNRFCGMCGATLLAAPAVAETQTRRAASASPIIPAPVATPAAPSLPRHVEDPRPTPPPSAPPPQDPPTISGPSFLGLNDPAPRRRASLSIDPHAPGSRGVDYLLDDEDEHRGGGAGKFVLILIALALAVGFGYLRWKNGGFAWLNTSAHKPSAAAQSPSDTDANAPSNSPAPASPNPTPDSQTSSPSQPATTQPASTPPATAPAQPAASTPATSTPAGANTAASPPSETAAPSSTAPPKSNHTNAAKPSTPADSDDSDTADDNDTAQPAPKPAKPAPKEVPTAKPSAAAPKPVRTGDPVGEAQKYLYGKGAPQDCDRGLRLLKPAANEANPKAMIQMGALYSAGLCTPRDLPTAYRWFALALRKDPDNMAVQTDLQKLWGEMTQPERQLAIKLSQ